MLPLLLSSFLFFLFFSQTFLISPLHEKHLKNALCGTWKRERLQQLIWVSSPERCSVLTQDVQIKPRRTGLQTISIRRTLSSRWGMRCFPYFILNPFYSTSLPILRVHFSCPLLWNTTVFACRCNPNLLVRMPSEIDVLWHFPKNIQ